MATATIGMSLRDQNDRRRVSVRMNIMANTYSHCYNHIVFSTKSRVDLITPDIEDRVWAYIGGIARKHNVTAIQVGKSRPLTPRFLLALPVDVRST
jgi:hypothetical protein